MKTFTTLKAIVAAVLCYAAIVTFSTFLAETVYAHSSSSSAGSSGSINHDHGRIVSVSELLPSVTLYTAGLVIGFTLLFWRRKWKEVLEGTRTLALRFTKPFYTWPR
jgi:hypothetical protein